MRDDTWCQTRNGQQLHETDYAAILTPINSKHLGHGHITRLLPGTSGDAPCVEIRDALGTLFIVNAVNVSVEDPADWDAINYAAKL